MKNILKSFTEIFDVLRKDKIIIMFSLLPIIIGIVLFSTIGAYVYTDGINWGERIIHDYITNDTWGGIVKYFFVALITAGFYFLISFGFVLLVSVIASPFNDIISERTQVVVSGKVNESLDTSIKRLITNFFKTIINELKKVSFILFISLLALVFSFIPILIPIGMILSALLMAINFLDYSWSRERLTFRGCLSNVKKNLLTYLLSGGLFLIIISIPLINLLALPMGVIYFTIIYAKSSGLMIEDKSA